MAKVKIEATISYGSRGGCVGCAAAVEEEDADMLACEGNAFKASGGAIDPSYMLLLC